MSAPLTLDLRTLSAAGADAGPAGASVAAGPPPAGGSAGLLALELAARIAAARLVCFPTDTVYGLGGVVTPEVAAAVVTAKGREPGKPLQVVYPGVELLQGHLALPPVLRAAVRRLLPGPFTLVLPYPAGLAFPPPGEVAHVSPGRVAAAASSAAVAHSSPADARLVRTIGVRVPEWPRAARLMGELPFPLLASSANRSGEPAPGSLGEVDPRLLAACDLVLDAGPVHGEASTVLDLSLFAEDGSWRVLRAGAAADEVVRARLRGLRP